MDWKQKKTPLVCHHREFQELWPTPFFFLPCWADNGSVTKARLCQKPSVPLPGTSSECLLHALVALGAYLQVEHLLPWLWLFTSLKAFPMLISLSNPEKGARHRAERAIKRWLNWTRPPQFLNLKSGAFPLSLHRLSRKPFWPVHLPPVPTWCSVGNGCGGQEEEIRSAFCIGRWILYATHPVALFLL